MSLLSFFRRRKNKQALPMHPENILLIASSPQEISDLMDAIHKVGYIENSDLIRLDNGDFSVVIKKRVTSPH